MGQHQHRGVHSLRLTEFRGRLALDDVETGEVDALARACEAADGTDLKLELAVTSEGPAPAHWLARRDGRLIGYCGADDGADPEVCGMVHPRQRRAGVGAALLERMTDSLRARGRSSALVICEDVAPVAETWMARLGGTRAHSELRMVRPAGLTAPAPAGESILRRAEPGDVDGLVDLLSSGFPEHREAIRRLVGSRTGQDESLVAEDSSGIVATVRVVSRPRRKMIYGLVVREDLRGQRIGTRVMSEVLRLPEVAGSEIALEVEPGNAPAVRLYEGFGFQTSTTYRYLRLPL